MSLHVVAGQPSCVHLDAPSPIPADVRLTFLLSGPRILRGTLTDREVSTTRIEARFTCRTAGDYLLQVEQTDSGKALLHERITVAPGPLHTSSCTLLANSMPSRTFCLEGRDAFDNIHCSGGTLLKAAISNWSCAVGDAGDGTYTITLPANAPHGPQLLRVWAPRELAHNEVQLPVYIPRKHTLPVDCRLLGKPVGIVGMKLDIGMSIIDATGSAADADTAGIFAFLGSTQMHVTQMHDGSTRGQLTATGVPKECGSFELLVWVLPRPDGERCWRV